MAILATQRVLTHDYWKIAEDITPGDIVFDRHGKPVKVKLVQSYRSDNCYRVFFDDGLVVAGDTNLRLPVESEKYRKRLQEYKGRKKFKRPLSLKTIEELLTLPLRKRENRREYSMPTAGALCFPEQTLPVPPFVFGFWFYNHKAKDIMYPPPGYEDFVFKKLRAAGYRIVKKGHSHNGQTKFITEPAIRAHLAPLIPTKIPNNYLLASAEQRLDLLRGIIHAKSRQYNQRTDRFRITAPNKLDAKQIQYLAESLGCKTKLSKERSGFTVFIKTRLRLIENQVSPTIKVRQQWRFVDSIEPVKPQNCVYIETEGADNSILVGEGFVAVC